MTDAVAYQIFEATRDDVSISLFSHEDGDVLELTAVVSKPDAIDQITIEARFEGGKISFPKAEALTVAISLLAACVTVKATLTLIRAIARCIAEGHRNPKALLECLQKKGLDIGEDLFAGILECLALRVGAG